MWRAIIAVVGMLSAGVGGSGSARNVSAQLTIETRTGSVTSVLVPTQASLRCEGGAEGTGFLSRAAGPACALVRRGTLAKAVARNRKARLCSEIYGGPQTASITGRVGGHRVHLVIDRSDGCGIADWDKLGALLGEPDRLGRIPRPRRSTASTTTAPPITYPVARGDTLTKIARQFHTSVAAIVRANELTDPDHLTEGQQLVMPPPTAVRIDAKLVDGSTTSGFKLTLVGAQPSELVTFRIVLPDASTHTGSPHKVSQFGVATATYSGDVGSGTYAVAADGTAGTHAETSFHVKRAQR